MRNRGSSGVAGGAPPNLLPNQQLALQNQIGNMSNIHNMMR
jgi:hypothetical protein